MDQLDTGVMGNLAPKLLELLKEEYGLPKGLRKQVQYLSPELDSIYAALQKVAEVPPDQLDEQVKIWARKAREASYDIEDILDTFLLRVHGSESADTSSLQRELKRTGKLIRQLKLHPDAAIAVAHIKEPSATSVDPRLSTLYTEASQLVRMDESTDTLIKILLSVAEDGKSSGKTKTVSILGVGGLGKTTLAKSVYDKVNGQFDCRAFISVSRKPDLIKILKGLLFELDTYKYRDIFYTEIDQDMLIRELQEYLRDKRYFIVLDDIWELDSWQILKSALVDNNHGSTILTTTRKFEVAKATGEVYKLRPLSDEKSRRLFYTRIYGDEGKHFHNQLDTISDEILNNCGGIPLAIITMASLLVGKPRDQWSHLYNSIGFGPGYNDQIDDTMRILSFSYYDLPSHLRTCLLYLSVFPHDFVIKKNNLVWKWIAEGMVPQIQGKCLFEIGEGYFNDLINRSMIQAVEDEFDGAVQGCRVHSMVMDLIRCLSREENFVSIVDEGGQMFQLNNVRRLALHNRTEDHSLGNHKGLQHLRSLNAIGCPMYMIPPIDMFILLRVLDLESCGSMEGFNLENLGKLLHLRFISLRNTFVRKLPDEIGQLKFLQTLELEGSGVEELPARMEGLRGLMCLNADWTTRVPSWIGTLTSVQQLVMYPGGGDEYSARWFGKELRNLKEIRVLRLLIKAQDEGQLSDLLESLTYLEKIEVIHFDYYGLELNNRGVALEPTGFPLSRTLRILELRWLEFSRRPSWVNPQDLPNLCQLWLMVFDVDAQDLEIIGGFPELLRLQLLIVNTEGGKIITPVGGAFQNLKFFSITKPLQFVHGAMPSLEVLDFHVDVRLLKNARQNFDFDFGLGNMHSLRRVIVQIKCMDAFSEEVGKTKMALMDAIDKHPNHPTMEMSLVGQEMETFDEDLILPPKLEKIDEPAEMVIRKLSMVDNNASKKKMKIVSVLTSEGIGQTTLAQEVFDKHSPRFDCAAFVRVGQNANLSKVISDILIGLDKQKYKDFPMAELNLRELIGLLHKSLLNKRFFVVVDDLWDIKAWDIIKSALIENRNGSAILTTSCKTDVTEYIGGSMRFDPLSQTESKNLLCTKLFGLQGKCPTELEGICEKLLETCDGLQPKIIDAVKQLQSVPCKVNDWQAVYGGRKISGLPDHKKNCMLYFSMFQKGQDISAERLVWLWIAEDFVQTAEEGEGYLRDFIKEMMIEAVEVDAAGKALSCRVHDFVHRIVIENSREVNTAGKAFVTVLDGPPGSDLTATAQDRLSIQGNTAVDSLPRNWLSLVKSLVVSGDTMPLLSDFRDLRVLDLGSSLQNDHLKGINNAQSLRYLVIGGKCITCIPKEINFMKFKDLQTLDLRASGLYVLPKRVFRLKTLKRLSVSSHMKIPDGIAKMSALEELGDINITKPELLKELCKLSMLRFLRIAIWSWSDESLKSSVKQLCENMRSLVQLRENIQSLSLMTSCSLDFMNGLGDKWAPSLQKLEIRHSCFGVLPGWIGSLEKLSSLTIEVYKLSRDIIKTLGELSTLCSLSLTSKLTPDGCFFTDPGRFMKLESLKFASNAMPQNILASQKATQQLKRITIVFQASRTEGINVDFSFGLENLRALECVRVEIICFNASHRMVEKAEAAIRNTISRDRSSHPDLEIQRLEEQSMIKEVELIRDTEQNQEKTMLPNKSSSKKMRSNVAESSQQGTLRGAQLQQTQPSESGTIKKKQPTMIGHSIEEGRSDLHCVICNKTNSHLSSMCPILKMPKPSATFFGSGKPQFSFLRVSDIDYELETPDLVSTALVTVSGGKISAEVVQAELTRLIRADWKWEALPCGEDSFHVAFQSEEEMQRVKDTSYHLKNHGVTLTISASQSVNDVTPTYQMEDVWVHIMGVPHGWRHYLVFWALGTVVGATLDIDMLTYRKKGVIRVFVGCLKKRHFPFTTDLVFGTEGYDITYILEDDSFGPAPPPPGEHHPVDQDDNGAERVDTTKWDPETAEKKIDSA